LQGSVSSSWYWFSLLFYFLSSDSVIQPLEESNTFLELLQDIVRQGKGILDLVVQAPYECSMFHRVIPLNFSGIALEFYVIGGEVTVSFLEYLHFSFCCHHMIWVPKCHFQNRDYCWDNWYVDALISNIGLDLCEGLAY
jgi:hypothetical protein